jgi:hypothetical protein
MLVCSTCHNQYQCPQCDTPKTEHAHKHEHHSDGNHLSAKELETLKATKSIHEYRKVVEDIRAARSGSLPEDWMKVVLGRGGCAVDLFESWKGIK